MINFNLNEVFKLIICLFILYFFSYTFSFITAFNNNIINKINKKLQEVSKDINKNNKNFSKSYFNDIYPKLNLNDDNILDDINKLFESRELFINEKNVTNEYIRYIRPILKSDEEKYEHKFYHDIDHYSDY